MIRTRLRARKKLVSRFDESLAKHIERSKVTDYVKTLDVKKLGDFTDLSMDKQPTVFHCEMLKVDWEHLAEPGDINHWAIFQTHVKQIDNFPEKMEWSGDVLSDSMREYFPPKDIRDIAEQIIHLSNMGEDGIFFTPPADWLDFVYQAKARHAVERGQNVTAPGEQVAKVKSQEPDQNN